MKTVHITKDRDSYYEAPNGNTTYVLDKGVSINSTEAFGFVAYTDVRGRDLVIKGDVYSSQGYGIHVGSNEREGAGVLTIEKSGEIYGKTGVNVVADGQVVRNEGKIGGEIGLTATGDDFKLQNTGFITGKEVGVDISFGGGGVIRNDGFISGGKHGLDTLLTTGDTLRLVNNGTITSDEYGIGLSNLDGSRTVIVNHGDISGKFWAIQANFTNATEIIRNRGEISAPVWLGDGDDIYDGRGGHATYIDGGSGNDLYIIDDPLILLSEATNGGTDTVQSSVAWTLGTYFENLVLTGKDSITGKGSDMSNRITGNAGQNTLFGMGGTDIIDGGAGDDTLYGGNAADTFVFTAGHDTIADFQDGLDLIDITAVKAISDFSQIFESMTQVGADVVIDFGLRGTIDVDNTTIAKLTAIDFAY